MMLWALAALAFGTGALAQNTLQVYPAPSGVEMKDDFAVKVRIPGGQWQDVRYYSSAVFKRSLMRIGLMPAHPSFYCKREVYTKYGPFNTDYKIGADFESLLRYIYVNRIKTLTGLFQPTG